MVEDDSHLYQEIWTEYGIKWLDSGCTEKERAAFLLKARDWEKIVAMSLCKMQEGAAELLF